MLACGAATSTVLAGACSLDFGQFEPVVDASVASDAMGADGTLAGDAVDAGAAALDATSMDAMPDASDASAMADTQDAQTLGEAGDTGADAGKLDATGDGCVSSQGCLAEAGVCGAACGQASTTCQGNCGSSQCRQACRRTEQTCRNNCATACAGCSTAAGCGGAPCGDAAFGP